jgi:hypothetical protein
MRSKNGVFISHIQEEAPVADALKTYLKRCFGQALHVFVSSDYDSIPTGEEWYRAIVGGIIEADVVVVLLSQYSVDRRWINFESGVAVGAKVRILPLTIRGFSPGEVGLPLSQLHLRAVADQLALEGVVEAIAEATLAELEELDTAPAFIAQLAQIEATLPVKSIILEPLLDHNNILRFRLSNTGNRDVELIELEVRIPTFIIQSNWAPARIPNVLNTEFRKIGRADHLFIWEQPFEGALERIYGNPRTLPRIVSPHWTPRLSEILKIPIRADLEMPENWSIDYKVVARGLYSGPGRMSLGDIPVLE